MIMHEYVHYMHEGGYGTLEELLEVITWAQLGIHDKPVRFLPQSCHFIKNFKHVLYSIIYKFYFVFGKGGVVECRWLLQFFVIFH